jgi:hypothetical protein
MASSSKPSKDDKRPVDTKELETLTEDNPPPYEEQVNSGKHERVVKCSQGHLFTTIWIPLVSLKAVRLGDQRWQRCPVGRHWALIHRVPEAELSAAERAEAAAHHDIRIP